MTGARVAAVSGLALVGLAAILTAREVAIGRDEIAMADTAAGKSDWPMAISHARAAAEALAPGSPWPERGWQRLEAVGHDAEVRGDDAVALLAYGAMRSAAMATRGPLSGWATRRAQADDGLARVGASVRDPTGPRATLETMNDALHADEPPALWRLYAVTASAVALLGGLGRLAWSGEAAAGTRVAQALAAAGLVAYAVVALTQ